MCGGIRRPRLSKELDEKVGKTSDLSQNIVRCGQVVGPCRNPEQCEKLRRPHEDLQNKLKAYLRAPGKLKGKRVGGSDSDASATSGGTQKRKASSGGEVQENEVRLDIPYCCAFADHGKRAKLDAGT